MAIYDSFEDYREEIELSCVQNHGVELELYSIIAAVIREYYRNRRSLVVLKQKIPTKFLKITLNK